MNLPPRNRCVGAIWYEKKQYPDLSLPSPGFGLVSPISSIRRKLIPIQADAVDPRRLFSHCPQARV